MTPSRPLSPQIADRGRTLRFATPARLGFIAVIAMAVVAIALMLVPRGDAPPIAGVSPSATTSAEPTAPSLEPSSTPSPTLVPTAEPTPAPPAVWTGLGWSDPVTPSFTVHLTDLVPWGDGYVAVGVVPGQGPASLTSPDGLNWTIQQSDFPGVPGHVVAMGDELLAFMPLVGRPFPPGTIVGAPPTTLIARSTDGAIWTLIDSMSWEEAWHDTIPGVQSIPDGWDATQYDITIGLVDVASRPDGLVAIGNSYGDDEMVPILLHSTDGRAWTEVALPADSPSALLHQVVAFDDGFVLVGSVSAGPRIETATPAAWYSADGMAWTRAPVNVDQELYPDGIEGIGDFAGVTAAADGLLGWYGYREMVVGGPPVVAAWSSLDGRTWSPLDRDASAVPFGYSLTAGDGVHIVTLGPVPYPSTGQPWPGVSEGWVSSDGSNWTALDQSRVIDDMVEAMWVVPDGVIYAGVESFWFGTAIER